MKNKNYTCHPSYPRNSRVQKQEFPKGQRLSGKNLKFKNLRLKSDFVRHPNLSSDKFQALIQGIFQQFC